MQINLQDDSGNLACSGQCTKVVDIVLFINNVSCSNARCCMQFAVQPAATACNSFYVCMLCCICAHILGACTNLLFIGPVP